MSVVESVSRRYVIPSVPVRRFSVAEYLKLIDEGFFGADEQFELLDGFITPKMSRNPPHDAVLNRVRRRLEQILSPGWMIRVQSALQTADSIPEPDIAVVRGDDVDYQSRHPGAADAGLVIEIANTSLNEDRTIKLEVYAAAGITMYWVVNLIDHQIEVYTDPQTRVSKSSFRTSAQFCGSDAVPLPPVVMAHDSIPASELLFPGGH